MSIPGDNPIKNRENDALGRSAIARSFAHQVLTLDISNGAVVGVLGPWGSGKTSFVNLAREEFSQAGVPILDFNPWMFSGAEQLVESFFAEMAAQLKMLPGLATLGQGLEGYGETFSGMVWLPLVGPWIERLSAAARIIGKILRNRKESVGSRKSALDRALAKLDKPIVVVLDDIDRLSTSEIRDVFKLVRLTASFPNIIYIVAFDRERVEEALAEQGIPGRAYLEKILQVAVDLPVVPFQVLNHQIFSAIDGALAGIENPGQFDEQVWTDIFMEIIRPLIRNMRDVRRYAASIHGTVKDLNGQIALTDVLALEAVRVFLPDVFKLLHGTLNGLTKINEGRTESPKIKAQIEALFEAAGNHREVVQSMIERLFPVAQRYIGNMHYGSDWKGRWLRERRVAHEDILSLYLERVAGEGLKTFTDAERAWAYMTDQGALDLYLRSLDPTRQQDVIASLENFEDEFTVEQIVPSTTVLMNLSHDLPQRQRGLFEPDTRLVISRVTYRLLRAAKDPEKIESAIETILPRLTKLSSKMALIQQVGHREGCGHKLVSEEAATRFEVAWRREVQATSAHVLAREPNLCWIFVFAKRIDDPEAPPLVIDGDPELTITLLRAAKSEALSQTMGTRYVKREPRLAWGTLIDLYGDEATLRARIESLRSSGLQETEDIIGLADRYLGGWRPDD